MSGEQRQSSLSVTDNRTGRTYEIPIKDGAIPAMALRDIKVDEDDFGLLSYDPAFMNTASCRSAITFIDGEQGILRYRGYPIQELAERVSFLEVAWLLVEGDLPDDEELADWTDQINHHTFVKENIKKFIDGFHHDAHPMGILVSTVGALSTFYPDAKRIDDPAVRRRQMVRLIAKIPTLAAYAYRHARGHPYPYPDNELSYAGNFLNLMWKMGEPKFHPDPVLEHALDVLFTLHADHEQNCSTNAMRAVGSSRVDPYLERVKQGELKLMGFGHRVYKNYDPRARIIKQVADDVFKVTGLNPLLEIAVELERIALEDDFFVSKKLYPNVDFYSGIIYEAMGFPTEMFPVLFAIGRMPGWLAQWEENLTDPEQRIARPRQIYVGPGERHVERD